MTAPFTLPLYTGQSAEAELDRLLNVSHERDEALEGRVRAIVDAVRLDGDAALRRLAEQFGDTVPESWVMPPDAVARAVTGLAPEIKTLLETAAENIRCFALAVREAVQPVSLAREEFSAGLDWRPVARAACYVPGGRYPLPSTALMTAITAQVAGVQEITLVSPRLGPEVLYAGTLAGVSRFVQLGGAQAVAALAYGTASLAPVDLVVGPGNAYVTEAKRQLQGVIGIDMLAGPSEVVVIADAGAPPERVALDVLAQAEHDPDARGILLSDSLELAQAVARSIPDTCRELGLPDYVSTSLANSAILVLPSLSACVQAANALAPEHLALMLETPDTLRPQLTNYGALFLGYGATVPHGDYLAGPNHTLPTGRTARFSGGLNPMTFLRPQTWVKVNGTASALCANTAAFARLEGLSAHAAAAQARLEGPV